MKFVRQDIRGEPTPTLVAQALEDSHNLYADKIDRLTKLYDNDAADSDAFNLYKRTN